MPLYEYECQSCHAVTEALIRNDDEHKEQESDACPSCGKKKLSRTLSVTASPAMKGGGLPMASEGCGAPRCCGGGCDM